MKHQDILDYITALATMGETIAPAAVEPVRITVRTNGSVPSRLGMRRSDYRLFVWSYQVVDVTSFQTSSIPAGEDWHTAASNFGWLDPTAPGGGVIRFNPPDPPTLNAVPVIGYHFTVAEQGFATSRRFRTVFGALPSHVATLQNSFSADPAPMTDARERALAEAIQSFHGAIQNTAPVRANWNTLDITELFNQF